MSVVKSLTPMTRSATGPIATNAEVGNRLPMPNTTEAKYRRTTFCHLKQRRGIAMRYDKLAPVFRAATPTLGVTACAQRITDML